MYMLFDLEIPIPGILQKNSLKPMPSGLRYYSSKKTGNNSNVLPWTFLYAFFFANEADPYIDKIYKTPH